MTDAAPALPDAELRETLDLLSTVVASVSDRVDNQGNAIDKLTKTAAATRQAAFAAQKQTDPERYGEIIASTVDRQTRDALQQRVATIGELLSRERHAAQKVFNEVHSVKDEILKNIRREAEDANGWRKRIPFIAAVSVVLVLGFSVGAPRFMAVYGQSCQIIGGEWLKTTSEVRACVFYAD